MLENDDLDVELLINEVKSRECVWNYKCESHGDKILKSNAWAAVCQQFVPDFNEKTLREKNQIEKSLQKKWKILRDGYNRYVNKARKVKNGPGGKRLRQYIYFHQLSFLKPLAEEKADTVNSVTNHNDNDSGTEAAQQNSPTNICTQSKHTARLNQFKNLELDDDKLFLLALSGDFKKISDNYKLDAKTEILKVIKKYKVLSSEDYKYSAHNSYLYPVPSNSDLVHPMYSQITQYDRVYCTAPSTSTNVSVPSLSDVDVKSQVAQEKNSTVAGEQKKKRIVRKQRERSSLTDEQRKKFNVRRQASKSSLKKKQKGKRKARPNPPDPLSESVNSSDVQEKLSEISTTVKAERSEEVNPQIGGLDGFEECGDEWEIHIKKECE